MATPVRNKSRLLALLSAALLCGLVLAATAQARVTNIRIPAPDTSASPCSGLEETVAVSGIFHLTFGDVVDESGGFHQNFHSNFVGVEGVGLVSGDRYLLPQSFNLHTNTTGAYEFTITQLIVLVRAGSGGENFRLHAVTHVTITPDGEVTAQFQFIDEGCQKGP